MFKSLAENAVQGFSGCDEAKLSLCSREVSGDELTHLDKEVADNNHIN